MTERSQVLAVTMAGAAVGGLIGYLFFTASGRRLRGEIEPRLSEMSRELARLRDTVVQAYAAVNEGRHSFDRPAPEPGRWPIYEPHSEQDVPFV